MCVGGVHYKTVKGVGKSCFTTTKKKGGAEKVLAMLKGGGAQQLFE